MNYHEFNRLPDQHSYCICGELASAPCHQPQDLREEAKRFLWQFVGHDSAAHSRMDGTIGDCIGCKADLNAIINYIESLRLKSYEEGAKEFQKMGVWYDKGMADGRAALIADLLAEWPKKKEMEVRELVRCAGKVDPGMVQNIGIKGYNEGVEIGRAIIESKRTMK